MFSYRRGSWASDVPDDGARVRQLPPGLRGSGPTPCDSQSQHPLYPPPGRCRNVQEPLSQHLDDDQPLLPVYSRKILMKMTNSHQHLLPQLTGTFPLNVLLTPHHYRLVPRASNNGRNLTKHLLTIAGKFKNYCQPIDEVWTFKKFGAAAMFKNFYLDHWSTTSNWSLTTTAYFFFFHSTWVFGPLKSHSYSILCQKCKCKKKKNPCTVYQWATSFCSIKYSTIIEALHL